MLRLFNVTQSDKASIARKKDSEGGLSVFKSWDSPHLLTNQFQLLAKCIDALNKTLQPDQHELGTEQYNELEVTIINAFNHQMMPSWLALAKSYYPFYAISQSDKILIENIEKKLNVRRDDYETLDELIKKLFLSKYPSVHSQYRAYIENIKTVIAKLTAVAISTPALINDAHKHDHKKYEEAGPSMSNCISPVETILRYLMGREDVDKPFIIAATSLLLQVKAIKSYFEQLTLTQKLECIQNENNKLKAIEVNDNLSLLPNKHEEEEKKNNDLTFWRSKKEQLALVYVFKLQTKVYRYYHHLAELANKFPMDTKISAKLVLMTVIRTELDQEDVLPSLRLTRFLQQLEEASEQLKEHRDPIWIRFLRDCLRILMLTFSGIAVYRLLTNTPINFFKPSQGQQLIENVRNITKTYQEMSLQLA